MFQWVALGLTVWLVVLTILMILIFRRYRHLSKNVPKKDLEAVVKNIEELNSALKKLENKTHSSIQKVGFVRFNPFNQTGGDQSFCLSLLDANNNGFVLSSLHSRESTRFYAKTVKAGLSEGRELSKEERQAIKNAQ